MKIVRISELSNEMHAMNLDVTEEQLQNYDKGMHIQNAFPNLNSDEREFIMTGITPKEWTDAFGEEEEV
jgi:hypothetical protein